MDARDERVGKRLGDRYTLIKLLGSGAMGMVYEAVQDGLERRCAIKLLRHELHEQSSLLRRFKREAEVVAKLNHPNIVALYDFGVAENGAYYIVMEFVDGKPLEDLKPYRGVALQDVVYITHQLLSAMDAAHKLDIAHRDIKPENIVHNCRPDDPGFIKVLDFGLAKLLGDNSQTVLTATGEIFGSPLYMAPEQATGDRPISAATDIYALGVILFEMICGVAPYDAPTPLATMMQHVNAPIPALTPRPGLQISAGLAEMIRRCLQKNPDDRFPNAISALHALHATDEVRSWNS